MTFSDGLHGEMQKSQSNGKGSKKWAFIKWEENFSKVKYFPN